MATLEERFAKLKEPEPNPILKGAGEFNVGLSRLAGASVDLTNMLISPITKALGIYTPEPVGGSASIQSGLSSINAAPAPGEEGQDFGSRALQELGATAIPFLALGAKGAALLKAGKEATGLFTKSAIKTAEKPIISAAIESGAAVSAAGSGLIAEEIIDEPWARALGEVMGGLSFSVAASFPVARTGKATLVKGKDLISGEGAKARAAKRLASESQDVAAARKALSSENEFGLPPAEATGQAGIISLQKAAADSDPELFLRLAKQEARASESARRAALFGGDPEEAKRFLDHKLNQAAAEAQAEIIKTKGSLDSAQASALVREKIDKALTSARAAEKVIWNKIPKDLPATLDNSGAAFAEELLDRTIADDPKDIPNFLYELVGRHDKNGVFTKGAIESTGGTVKKLDALRKRIGAEIRRERAEAAPNNNKIRILREVEAGLFDDLESVVDQTVSDAVAYSKSLNTKFTQGAVGRLLGYERAGGVSYTPEQAMEVLSRSTGATQARAFKELLSAAPESRDAAIEFIKDAFWQQAVDQKTGIARPNDVARFLKRNRGLLKEIPELKDQIQRSMVSQQAVDEMLGGRVNKELSATQKAKTAVALYLDSSPGSEFDAVLKSRNPTKAIGDLINRVSSDKTGKALSGLKASFSDYMIGKSSISKIDALGNDFISGTKFLKFINDHAPVMSKLYSNKEIARLKIIGKALKNIEVAQSIKPARGGVIHDAPAKVIDLFAGTVGARAGAQLGAGTSGAALRTANIFSVESKKLLVRLTNDKAKELLVDAVEDGKLMDSLLTKATASPKKVREAFGRIYAWMGIPITTVAEPGDPQPTLEDRFNSMIEITITQDKQSNDN